MCSFHCFVNTPPILPQSDKKETPGERKIDFSSIRKQLNLCQPILPHRIEHSRTTAKLYSSQYLAFSWIKDLSLQIIFLIHICLLCFYRARTQIGKQPRERIFLWEIVLILKNRRMDTRLLLHVTKKYVLRFVSTMFFQFVGQDNVIWLFGKIRNRITAMCAQTVPSFRKLTIFSRNLFDALQLGLAIRPCCRDLKFSNRLAGCTFCCLFRYKMGLWLCKTKSIMNSWVHLAVNFGPF